MKTLLFILMLAVWSFSPASAQTDWKFNSDKDGIKIYTSILPESKIKAVKVEGIFNATAEQLVTLDGCKYRSRLVIPYQIICINKTGFG